MQLVVKKEAVPNAAGNKERSCAQCSWWSKKNAVPNAAGSQENNKETKSSTL